MSLILSPATGSGLLVEFRKEIDSISSRLDKLDRFANRKFDELSAMSLVSSNVSGSGSDKIGRGDFKKLFAFLLTLRSLGGAARIIIFLLQFFQPPYTTAPGFEPMSVELHQTGTVKGCSSDRATALREAEVNFNRH